MFPKISLVLGGARSGKSAFAESLAMSAGLPGVYIASAQAGDAEMAERIAEHQGARGARWRTIEAPYAVARELLGVGREETVLFDCATLWLSNQVLAEHDVETAQGTLISALRTCAANVVVVSSEVGHGVVPDNALARRFRDLQGRLNQLLAARADLVVFVTAGLPRVLKGELPDMGR